jgi:hypothetical protein
MAATKPTPPPTTMIEPHRDTVQTIHRLSAVVAFGSIASTARRPEKEAEDPIAIDFNFH